MSARQTQDSVAKDGSPILGLPRSRKGAWRRGRLDLTGGDLFLHDGNVRWRRRAVSDGNPRSPAQSPSCRDCAFLPVVRYRCLCRDRCRLSVTSSALRYPQEGVTSVTPVAQQCALGSVLHKCVLEQISRVWWHTLPKQQTGFGEAVERRSEKALSRAGLPPSTPIAAFVKRLRCRRWRSQSVLAARKAPPEKAS